MFQFALQVPQRSNHFSWVTSVGVYSFIWQKLEERQPQLQQIIIPGWWVLREIFGAKVTCTGLWWQESGQGMVPYAQCIIYPGKMTFSKNRETISLEHLPGKAAWITMGHVCCVHFGLSRVATSCYHYVIWKDVNCYPLCEVFSLLCNPLITQTRLCCHTSNVCALN